MNFLAPLALVLALFALPGAALAQSAPDRKSVV